MGGRVSCLLSVNAYKETWNGEWISAYDLKQFSYLSLSYAYGSILISKSLYDANALFLWSTGSSKGKKLPWILILCFLGDLALEIKISTVKDFSLLDILLLQK